mgnify:CR=1 FL=1
MPSKHIEVKTFKLAHSSDDTVRIEHIEKPYGEYSSPVVSIAIFSHGKTKVSEVEIPYENIGEFLKALNEGVLKKQFFMYFSDFGKIHDDKLSIFYYFKEKSSSQAASTFSFSSEKLFK